MSVLQTMHQTINPLALDLNRADQAIGMLLGQMIQKITASGTHLDDHLPEIPRIQ